MFFLVTGFTNTSVIPDSRRASISYFAEKPVHPKIGTGFILSS